MKWTIDRYRVELEKYETNKPPTTEIDIKDMELYFDDPEAYWKKWRDETFRL